MVKAFSHDRPITNWNNQLTARCFDNAESPGAVSSKFVKANLAPLMATFFEKIMIDHMTQLIEKACKNGITAEDVQRSPKSSERSRISWRSKKKRPSVKQRSMMFGPSPEEKT